MGSESFFLFNEDGTAPEDLRNFWTDWSAASDMLARQKAVAQLTVYLEHIGFPKWAMLLLQKCLMQPMHVDEHFTHSYDDGEVGSERYQYLMYEGLPMGLSFTKTCLHLLHT